MKMSSLARKGSDGNTKLLSKYGGRHKERPYKFANGGVVGAPRKAFADGGVALDGESAKPRLDRPSKKAKGKDKKGGKTTVNVVVASKGEPAAPPPVPMGGPPMPPPGGPPPPPMPMRKNGGAVSKYARGGKVHMTAGAASGEGRLEKIAAEKRK